MDIVQHNDPTTEAAAKAAFEVEQRIKGIVREMRRGWVLLAGELHHFHTEKLWRSLGYRSFDEWCADPSLDIGRRHIYGLIEVWQQLVVDRGVNPTELEDIEVSKIRDVLPAIRRGQVLVTEALEDVRSLSRDDMRVRYNEAPALLGPDTSTRYDAEDEPEYALCPTCGSRYRRKT